MLNIIVIITRYNIINAVNFMTIGIVSPYPISRKGLCALLSSIPQVTIVFDVDILDLFEIIQKMPPTILLFEAVNPAQDLEVILRTRKLFSQLKILLLSDCVDEDLEFRAIRAGTRGCISKREDPQVLARALAVVAQGEIWISQRAGTRIIGEFVRSRDKESHGNESNRLSRRESEIVALVARGYRNKQIAAQLFICESTIKTHLYAIYKKLQIGSRMEAILYYYHHLKEGTAPAGTVTAAPLPIAEPKMSDLHHRAV